MYKISYNQKVIKLAHTNLASHLHKNDASHLTVHYPGNVKYILNYLDKIEKNEQLQFLYILSRDVERLKKDFFSQFKIVKAAGGLVLNTTGQVLFIYRRGNWDLPKGKMESNEGKRVAAKREVVEETGLANVEVMNKLINTYHIYIGSSSQKRILKPTYWFLMHSTSTELTPQTDEDIELAEWKNLSHESLFDLQPIYSNIKDVLKEYLRLTL